MKLWYRMVAFWEDVTYRRRYSYVKEQNVDLTAKLAAAQEGCSMYRKEATSYLQQMIAKDNELKVCRGANVALEQNQAELIERVREAHKYLHYAGLNGHGDLELVLRINKTLGRVTGAET